MPLASELVAPDVVRVPTVFVNAYLVGPAGGPWILVDTGLPGMGAVIRGAAEDRHGDRPPEAVVLTHGHFDHAGNAAELAEGWDVPIVAHERELPYLTGRSDYPPQDPTPGGAIAFLSRFFPTSGYDFGDRVRALPADGTVPGVDGWRWLHTPGHTAGHVSLWREADRTLIAGDAVATMDLDSWAAQVTHEREVSRSPVPFTPDWQATRASVDRLADLRPEQLAAGHGRAITDGAAVRLAAFAGRPYEPSRGRYVPQPVRYDATGAVERVPPPVSDPVPVLVAGGTAGAVVLSRLLRPRS